MTAQSKVFTHKKARLNRSGFPLINTYMRKYDRMTP